MASNAVILCDKLSPDHEKDDYQEHMVDAAHILAVQKLITLFPKVHFVTDIHYRFNIRFMFYAEKNAIHTTAKTLVSSGCVCVCVCMCVCVCVQWLLFCFCFSSSD